jgi:hypothetical protein
MKKVSISQVIATELIESASYNLIFEKFCYKIVPSIIIVTLRAKDAENQRQKAFNFPFS